MKKILIISPDDISKKMAGPSIRYWNIATQLSTKFEVHLTTPNQSDIKHSDFQVFRYVKSQVRKNIKSYDAILVQGLTLFKNSYLKYCGVPLIVDLYDPFVLEMLEERDHEKDYKLDLEILLEQIRCGDYFICASEKQRDLWIGFLLASKKLNIETYREDKSLKNMIGIVPFGMSSKEPVVQYNPYQKYQGKKIILWGGGLWNWLDPITLLQAFGRLVTKRDDIVLFFMGVKHPNDLIEEKTVVKKMKEVISTYDLNQEAIIFNDWVPYDERQCYYKNAHVAVTTYYDNLETRFSFRTRVLDYIWCDLPMVLTKGDVLSTVISDNQCGLTVNPQNIDELATAIERLLDDQALVELCKLNIESLKEQYSWGNSVHDLISICEKAKKNKQNIRIIVRERILGVKLKTNFYFRKLPLLFKKNSYKKIVNHMKGR